MCCCLILLLQCQCFGIAKLERPFEHQQFADIAKKNGDKMQTCTQAMMIGQLFLQAKDETRYKEWKAKETADCKSAGMPTL